MQRFFFHTPLGIDLVITDPQRYHQMISVLRLKEGDEVIGFDGDGSETIYRIHTIEKKRIFLQGQSRAFPRDREPQRHITLYQALPNRSEKIEWLIQKSVEIGVKKIVFFRADFSQKLILTNAKKSRLESIAIEALEQCQGLVPMEIEYRENIDYREYCESRNPSTLSLVLHTSQDSHQLGEYMTKNPIDLWVGPEGGWSPREIGEMSNFGMKIVRFGGRVLRTETAGMVVAFGLIHT